VAGENEVVLDEINCLAEVTSLAQEEEDLRRNISLTVYSSDEKKLGQFLNAPCKYCTCF